jgi:hypothetical protein
LCTLRCTYGRFLSGGIILGSPLSCTDLLYSYTQQPCLQLAVTYPLPSLILLLNWRQEYSYRLRNLPILCSYLCTYCSTTIPVAQDVLLEQ